MYGSARPSEERIACVSAPATRTVCQTCLAFLRPHTACRRRSTRVAHQRASRMGGPLRAVRRPGSRRQCHHGWPVQVACPLQQLPSQADTTRAVTAPQRTPPRARTCSHLSLRAPKPQTRPPPALRCSTQTPSSRPCVTPGRRRRSRTPALTCSRIGALRMKLRRSCARSPKSCTPQRPRSRAWLPCWPASGGSVRCGSPRRLKQMQYTLRNAECVRLATLLGQKALNKRRVPPPHTACSAAQSGRSCCWYGTAATV